MTTENTDPRNGSSGNSYETGHYGTAPDPSTNPFGPASNGQNSYAGQFHHMAPDNSAFPSAANSAANGTGVPLGAGAAGTSGPSVNGSMPYGGVYGGLGGPGSPAGPGGPGNSVPGYYGPAPKRPKQRWSTALLSLTAVLSLVLGGAIRTQLDTLFDGNATADASSSTQQQQGQDQQGQQNQLQSPQAVDPSGSADSSIDAGTKVDSAPGVVLINTLLFNGAGAGTGLILSSSGFGLTNYHLGTGSETVEVTIADTGKQYEAEVLGHDAVRDVAVLQIKDGSGFDTVTTSSAKLAKGDTVSAIGNGSGQGYLTELQGEVTGLDQTITAMDEMSPSSDGEVLTGLIATDADVVPGYSGGPLVNKSGEVVGITTAASQGTTSEQVSGYAVPIATAMDIVNQITSGNVTSDTIVLGRNPALGVTVAGGNVPGAQIVEVLKGSAADEAGLKEGDTVTAVDGTAITDASMLSSLIKEYQIGDTVTLKVTGQDGTERDVDVTLSESSVN